MPPDLYTQGVVGVTGVVWVDRRVGFLAVISISGESEWGDLLSGGKGDVDGHHFLNPLRMMSCARLLGVASGSSVITVISYTGGTEFMYYQ